MEQDKQALDFWLKYHFRDRKLTRPELYLRAKPGRFSSSRERFIHHRGKEGRFELGDIDLGRLGINAGLPVNSVRS